MFTFKKFTVKQENSAMKVCTDACLFGALIDAPNAFRALDIGAGTGLLSLMFAQRNKIVQIDAVELDGGACSDAQENFNNSPFKNQLKLHNESIQNYKSKELYDVIFSNPPFYSNQLKSSRKQKNIAHHCAALSFDELIQSCETLLNPSGALWILLPPFEMKKFSEHALLYGFKIHKKYTVKHNSSKPIFREIIEFKKTPCSNPISTEILIYENDKYSRIFTKFLKDYYLIF